MADGLQNLTGKKKWHRADFGLRHVYSRQFFNLLPFAYLYSE
jgi:hypothetical protein